MDSVHLTLVICICGATPGATTQAGTGSTAVPTTVTSFTSTQSATQSTTKETTSPITSQASTTPATGTATTQSTALFTGTTTQGPTTTTSSLTTVDTTTQGSSGPTTIVSTSATSPTASQATTSQQTTATAGPTTTGPTPLSTTSQTTTGGTTQSTNPGATTQAGTGSTAVPTTVTSFTSTQSATQSTTTTDTTTTPVTTMAGTTTTSATTMAGAPTTSAAATTMPGAPATSAATTMAGAPATSAATTMAGAPATSAATTMAGAPTTSAAAAGAPATSAAATMAGAPASTMAGAPTTSAAAAGAPATSAAATMAGAPASTMAAAPTGTTSATTATAVATTTKTTGQTTTAMTITTTAAEPDMPSNPRLILRETDRLGLEWTGSADTYRVTYQPSGDTGTVSVSSTPNTTHTIGNLTAGTSYAVRVYGVSGYRQSAPLEGHWDTMGTDTLNVTWTATSSANFYRVTYEPSDGPEMDYVASTTDTTHSIGSLSPGTLYTVRVYGIKNVVEGEPLQGDQRTDPEAPTNLLFFLVDTDRLGVTWDASISAHTYRLTYQASGGPETGYAVQTSNARNILGLSAGTLYTIRVYGVKNDSQSLPLEGHQRTNPEAPTNLRFITVNTDSLDVSWNASSSADSYRVTFNSTSGGVDAVSVNSTSNTTYTIENLLPGTLYTVRIYSLKAGSVSVSLQGVQGTRPEAPTNFRFSRLGTDRLVAEWNASSSADTYRVTYQTSGDPEIDSVVSTPNTTHIIGNLTAGTVYTVRVYGISHRVESDPLQMVLMTKPEAPTNLQFITVDTDSLEVFWTASGSADTYRVTYQASGGAETASSHSISGTTHTIGGLSAGTLYTVRVYSLRGLSESDSLQGHQGTKPEAPTNFRFSRLGTDRLVAEWNASSSADTYRVTYQVSGDPEIESVASTPNTTHIIGNLTAGTVYTVRVYGISHRVESDPLQMVLMTKPEAPTNLQFITVDTDSLEVFWNASSSADTYRVTYQAPGGAETASAHSISGTSHTIGGLSAGTLYTVRVYSLRGLSESDSLQGDQGTRPEPPTNLQYVTGSVYDIEVSWHASSSVDTYKVTYQAFGDTENVDVIPGYNSGHGISGLQPGTLYTVRVYGIKNGVASLPIEGSQRTIVAMPSFITFTEITENSINITWGSADGAKDNYSISISPADGDNPTGSVDDGEPLEYLFTGLMGWTFYTVSIRTVSGGVTSEENWAARRTDVAPPRNVSIVEATENSINITWAAAAGNKDSYVISISPRDGDNHAGTVYDGDPLEYTFTGLTPGTLYTISVVTEASKRESVASTKIQRTKPNPPGTITTDTVSASIAAWEPSTGGVVSGYGVLFTSDDGSPRHTLTVDNATSNTASSPVALTTGALYTLEVFAFSDEGGYRTESDRTIITNITSTLAPTPLLQTCGPSFARINILEETSSATTYTVSIPDVTSCQNCSIVYGKATCFIDDMFNVSSFVVANSSSGTTCNLIVTNPIDRETTPSVRFGISWTRMVYNLGHVVSEDCGSIPVEILVEDVNDNPPVFRADIATTFYLRDRTPVQTILAVASAEDADTGANAAVAYSIPSVTASEYFEVDNNGVVTARRELTQNLLGHAGLLSNEQVEVVVMATDGVHNATTTLPFTFIDTGGVNTTSSKFGVTVPEEQPPGTPVINLREQRPFDDGDIIYSFTHSSKNFELNSTTGEVTTAEVLDREEEELYELTISAADPGGCYSSASIEITVQVEDVNDHSPVFLETAYSGRIAEDAGTGQPVAIDGRGISATDADFGLNSHITYSIDCCQNVFAIDNNTGEITTIAGLDRENTPVYHLTIVAEDNPSNESLRRESRANLMISVLDINDHSPTFIEISPVRMSLYENETEDSIIATLKAVDPDEGANGRVFYEIRSGAEGRFTVNSRTGEVKIADELDRETKDFYRLEILASDGGNPPLVTGGFYLEITVEDVNDNTPAFTAPDYELSVLEETEVGTVLGNITAEDPDIGTNAQIQYSFTEAVENFAIDENTGTLTVVSVLDFDNATHPKQSSFKVQASDVTAVDATDKDSGTNAEVSYSLANDSSTLFSIDPSNGIIRLVGHPGSTDTTYNLTVAATDKGDPPMNSTVSLSIKISAILDTSDTRVSFNGVEFEGHVEENNDDVQVATQLDAVVQHGSTPAPADCPLKYKMAASSDDSEFTVNETTGEISTRGARFDRETRARYTFAVVVEITCPGKSFDYTSVTIHVNDTNDQSPTFDSSSYNFEALEGTTGVVVGTILATDMDTGSNADFSYTIYPNGSPFSIDANGAITVSTPLDRETTDSYTLTILAGDMGVPSLNGTTTVHVRVLDTNDHAPAFADTVYHTNLREDENKAELNISISASDEDFGTNGDIRFSLHGEGSDLFSIDDMSGVIHLTGRLDYEERSSYNLTIAATDKGHPNRTSTVPLLVEVTDVNDNPPVFERDNYNASTHRNVPTTDVLVTVSATDQDSGVNALVFYTITGQYGLQPAVPTIGEAMFNINSSTGDIRATTHLFQDDIHQYELIVTATDMGEPQLSTTTKVVVDVANTNFFAPELLDTPVLHTMSEDSGVLPFLSRRVRTIRASDNDTEAEGQVRILLSSNDDISELFWITGTRTLSEDKVFEAEIWTNAILDRETHPSGLNITVLAVDQGATPKTSTAWVHVTLEDVNDNPPNLTVPERVAIPQSSPPGSSVVTLEVVDLDVNNQFSFEAVSEYFSIIENTGEIYTIREFPDTTGVSDGRFSRFGSIPIFVGNPNFHSPMFDQTVYEKTVQQDLQVGTNLNLNIFACDLDCPDSCNVSQSTNCTEDSGRLTYGIAENIRDIFVINVTTGIISTQWPLESTITNYSLVVIAIDQAENPRTGSAMVWINVEDVGTTPAPTTPLQCPAEEQLQNLRYVLFGVSGFAGLLLMITIGLVVRLVTTQRRVKYMSTAHLTTPAFTASQYDYVPAEARDYAYAEGIGADEDTPPPPPVADRPPLRTSTLNNEPLGAQATDRGSGSYMEMRSRMRSELQRQERIDARARGDGVYRELKYGYLPLNTAASGPADPAADKYGYLKPGNLTRLNNQRQPNNTDPSDTRRNDMYTTDIPSPDYDMLPRNTRL
ncbi:hypothetical protein Bbelb_258780 [Branchiostoma belcheri]|nr:hypothetical protein Bbelb_258780 [Branchiostoma belcheri]